MITQELTAYVKSELNRGKSRDEVRNSLLSGGGWSEADIAEVFRDVMPKDSTAINIPAPQQMQAPSSFIKPTVINKPAHHFPWKAMIFALIFGALCFTGWYYRSSLLSLPDKVISMFNKPEKACGTCGCSRSPESASCIRDNKLWHHKFS
jgi:hypothetical protein